MEGPKDNDGKGVARSVFVPIFALLCGLAATLLATYLVGENIRVRNRQHLLDAIHQIEQSIESRMEAYISLLRGGAGVFAANGLVTQGEFRKFFERLEIPSRYPGIQGYGYSVRLPPDKVPAAVAIARRQGMTNFHIWPEGQRREYHAIIYLEPQDERNRRALGFDMSTEAVRREAMDAARDSGNAMITGKVRLVQELRDEGAQAGFLIYVPTYLGGDVPPSVEERRKKLQGFIYSPFRAGNLFSAMVPARHFPGLGFAIWDGTNAVPENLLHQSGRIPGDFARGELRVLEMAGRSWTLGFFPTRQFSQAPGSSLLAVVPFFGVLASGLLFSLAYREARARRRSEEAAKELSRQREWLDVTLASTVDAVITTDTFGRVEFMNAAAEEIMGETLANARGKPVTTFFSIRDEETRRPLQNPAEQVLTNGEIVHFNRPVLLRTPGGTEKNIDPSGAPIRDRHNELLGAVLVFRETTERRKYERRSVAQHAITEILSESPSLEDALPRLLESIGHHLQFDAGIWWRFDETSARAAAGPVWQRGDSPLSAYARGSLSLRPLRDEGLPGKAWAERHPVYVAEGPEMKRLPRAAEIEEAGLRALLAFPVLTEKQVFGALEFVTRESLEFDRELQNVLHGLGRQIGQFIERKNAEQALAESEELYRAISETAADGIIVIDEESRILTVNSAVELIFGYTKSELCGTFLTELMPERMRERHLVGIRRFISTGEKTLPWEGIAFPGLRRDGSEVPLEISFGATKRRGTYLFTGLVRDITERKRVEEAIRELNQDLELRVERRTAALLESKEQMEAFSYSVAHDLRAPLRAMQGFAYALLEETHGSFGAEGENYLRRIMSAAERMDILIQDLLSYSQLSRSELQLGAVSLGETIEAALDPHAGQIKEKKAEIELRVPEIEVEAHGPTLEHAFSNLISNALKFTPAGKVPRIKIEAEANYPFVRVWVRDNGIGIAPSYHERIFRVFERLHGQEEYPGTGIGLAIVKKGIERMGGKVGIQSALGEGTSIWMDLRGCEAQRLAEPPAHGRA